MGRVFPAEAAARTAIATVTGATTLNVPSEEQVHSAANEAGWFKDIRSGATPA